MDRIIADIAEKRPSFVLNNLVGPSSYAFLEAMARLAERDPAFSPDKCPVASCDLMESELAGIASGAAVGQLCAASYFDSLATPENLAFKKRLAAWNGSERRVSSAFAGAYEAVRLCIGSIEAAGSDEPGAVRSALMARRWPSLLGDLNIDPANNHAALPFLLGQINAGNGYDVVAQRPAIPADPYLSGGRARTARLRVVS